MAQRYILELNIVRAIFRSSRHGLLYELQTRRSVNLILSYYNLSTCKALIQQIVLYFNTLRVWKDCVHLGTNTSIPHNNNFAEVFKQQSSSLQHPLCSRKTCVVFANPALRPINESVKYGQRTDDSAMAILIIYNTRTKTGAVDDVNNAIVFVLTANITLDFVTRIEVVALTTIYTIS